MSTTRRYFSGDSIEQALLQAARYFHLEPSEVDYRLVEKRHGFLKVRRRVVIEVDAAAPRKTAGAPPAEPPASAPTPGAPRPAVATAAADEQEPPAAPAAAERSAEPVPAAATAEPERRRRRPRRKRALVDLPAAPVRALERFPRAEGTHADAAREALEHIREVGDLDLQWEVLQGEERLEVELFGEDQDLLLEDRGRLLLAIQHLLPRVSRGLLGEAVPCRVDSDNFHEIRAEQLRDLAQRAAADVRERGRPKTLEPMSPDERRIVHLTLTDDPAVSTESSGDGLFKRVTVKPTTHRRPRGFDPYSR